MGSSIKIDIRSEGCNDPGKTPNTCGRAYIKVNDVEHAKQGRGHNVVVVDAVTGKELQCWYLNAAIFLKIILNVKIWRKEVDRLIISICTKFCLPQLK